VRARIGLTGQYASVDEDLTGTQNLLLIGQLLGLRTREARFRAAELLEWFDLTAAAGRTAKTYSGGMRRRLDLAASLVGRPAVIFLDEPTTGLDPAKREEMWDVVRKVVHEGSTVLLTTQYLEEADRLADEIVVLSGGRTVAAGTPAELKARVGDRRVHLSITADGALAIAARVFERLDPELDVRARRLSLPAPDGPRDLTAALDALAAAGIAVDEAALSRPTLDDAFFALAAT
jgi:ABC-type multidrug transport system ATPase subunit